MAKTLDTPHPNSPTYNDGDEITAGRQPLVVIGEPCYTLTDSGIPRISLWCRKPRGQKRQMATQDWIEGSWTDLQYHELNW